MGDISLDASDFELMLARAFDLAWEDIEGEAANTAEYRGALAARIIVVARIGECDEAIISAVALTYLRALHAARRLGKASSAVAEISRTTPGAMLDPDAVAAAAAAYESCLDELPEGIPAAARSMLLQAILANASTGERDNERLRRLALEALRSRR